MGFAFCIRNEHCRVIFYDRLAGEAFFGDEIHVPEQGHFGMLHGFKGLGMRFGGDSDHAIPARGGAAAALLNAHARAVGHLGKGVASLSFGLDALSGF